MTKICKQYISDVKTLFPILGKDERQYISILSTNIEDFCANAHIESREDLYSEFGNPADTVNTYFSSLPITDTVKKIRITKWIKVTIIAILVIATCVSITGTFTYDDLLV